MSQVKFLLIFFLSLSLTSMLAFSADHGNSDKEAGNDSGSPVGEILARAETARMNGEVVLSDSLAHLAITEARLSYQPKPLLKAYIFYLHWNSGNEHAETKKQYADEMEELIRRIGDIRLACTSHIVLAEFYLQEYDNEKALTHGYQALSTSEMIEDESYKVRSLLALGNALEAENRKMEAFRNYQNALLISSGTNDKDLIRSVYKVTSRFYNFHKMYEQAVEYKLKEAELLKSDPHIDSLELMKILYDLEGISLNSRASVNIDAISRIVEFALSHHNDELLNSAQALLRTYYINSEKIAELHRYYQAHPRFLESLKEYNYLTYIRLMAILKEYEGDFSKASDYFRKAEMMMENQGNPILKSHFYLRYAQFLYRSDLPDSAIIKAKLALEMSKVGNYLDYTIEASELLEQIYLDQESYREAHDYSRQTRELGDSLREIARSEDLMTMELENAGRIQEMEAERLAEEKRRRHNIQYTAFIIAILSLFVILIMLGSFRVPKWSIQALGFFAFIFFFEFIILLADTEIHHMTHGEPWKILAIKVVLIAILLPFHHWLEHRVVTYLIKKRMINISGFSFRKMMQNIWGSVFKH